jgi:polyisoprenoid-binding protein YceI
MKTLLIALSLLAAVTAASGQKYMTKNGFVGFFSHTPIEDIKADNNQVAGVIDQATGELVFQVLVKSFKFEKALMEEHFNENYMDSEKFPKSTFKGKIKDLASVDFGKPGKYDVTVEGDLTIKDATRKISVPGNIVVGNEGITANAKFQISPEDYNIAIPGIVREKIAKNIDVTVMMKYSKM